MAGSENQARPPVLAGLFTGLISSTSGRWIPMAQLRRFTSTGSWMLAFGLSLYGISRLAEKSDALASVGILQIALLLSTVMIIAATSFWAFLFMGSREFKKETGIEEKERSNQPHIK